MSNKAPSLFQNLSLRDWYKYLLYVAGVLLVLGVIFGTKLDVDVIGFSLGTMVLMIILWLVDDGIYYYGNDNNAPTLLGVRTFLHGLFFFIWIIIAFTTL